MRPEDILPWIFGIIVLGVPAVAVSVRIAARPVLEGLAKLREASNRGSAPPAPDPRVDQLQAEVAGLRERLDRLSSVEDFYAELRGPADASPRLPGQVQPPA